MLERQDEHSVIFRAAWFYVFVALCNRLADRCLFCAFIFVQAISGTTRAHFFTYGAPRSRTGCG